jgi:hypothetical protein
MKIHHLGIVVSNVDEALAAFGLNRSRIRERVFDPNQKNTLHFIYLPENDLWLELVEPMDQDSSTYTFAKQFGLGLHHLGTVSDDLQETELRYSSIPGCFTLGRYQITVESFGGRVRTLFIAVKGLILEFVQIEQSRGSDHVI